jgi:uncharacterized protein
MMMRAFLLVLALATSLSAAGETAFDAARNNRIPELRSYLTTGGDVDGRDPNGHTLLILAAYNGSLEAVDLLLAKGAHPNLQDNMGTALMAASFKGYAPIVRKLIASGAKVDDRNGIGATALMFASMSARFEVVKILLKHQADVRATDSRGLTAKSLAEGQGNEKMLKVLNKAH